MNLFPTGASAVLRVIASCALLINLPTSSPKNVGGGSKCEETVKTVQISLSLTNTPLKQGVNDSLGSDAGPEVGRKLFDRNCAHCHGEDARGDEGPSLHNLKLSDVRITKRIKEGIKGEMPAFGSKLDDRDIHSLIVYLRNLKD